MRDNKYVPGTANAQPVTEILTADDLLTALAAVAPEYRASNLGLCGVPILREAADLCGVGDAETLSKRAAIKAITENF
jgi:hypothetical protein